MTPQTKRPRGQQPLTPTEIGQRRATILRATLSMMLTYGYGSPLVTRDSVAGAAGVSAGVVNRYFGTFALLREAAMQEAVEQRHMVLIAQGIAHSDAVALSAPPELRSQALAVVGGDF